jgi:signal transduction histidine kinase
MDAVLDRISRNGKHLLGLINDVLDLSKIEAGQLVLALEELFAQGRRARRLWRGRDPGPSKNLAFKVEMPPNLPTGRGDERRLTQVLLNLVGNAIKFTDQGAITIKASAPTAAYNLAVQDTGPASPRRPGKAVPGIPAGRQIRSPRPRAAPAWASPFPSESSRCTGAESG